MSDRNLTPQPSDAVLGGQNPDPRHGAILGGIEGIKQKLSHPDLELRLEALGQALNYGDAGRVCLEEALSDRSKTIRRQARWLLRQPQSTGKLLPPLPLWNLIERFASYLGYSNQYATRFANRDVVEFQTDISLSHVPNVAYALRCDYDEPENQLFNHLETLVNQVGGDRIEALVFGCWDMAEEICTGESSSSGLVESLVAWRDRLPNLKALFVGDVTSQDCEISWIKQSDLSPLLPAYPQLEMLQVRGGDGLKFSPIFNSEGIARHESLKTLVVETGGLSRETVHQIYAWDFPALEHLELWFGSDYYGGDCQTEDLSPILVDLKFPNLTYLGLRNSSFADQMMDELVRSPILAGLQVLDLSLGTLSDEGAVKLLECPAIRDLETLNVSECYLSGAVIDSLRSLGIEVLADGQRQEDDPEERYCVVAE